MLRLLQFLSDLKSTILIEKSFTTDLVRHFYKIKSASQIYFLILKLLQIKTVPNLNRKYIHMYDLLTLKLVVSKKKDVQYCGKPEK